MVFPAASERTSSSGRFFEKVPLAIRVRLGSGGGRSHNHLRAVPGAAERFAAIIFQRLPSGSRRQSRCGREDILARRRGRLKRHAPLEIRNECRAIPTNPRHSIYNFSFRCMRGDTGTVRRTSRPPLANRSIKCCSANQACRSGFLPMAHSACGSVAPPVRARYSQSIRNARKFKMRGSRSAGIRLDARETTTARGKVCQAAVADGCDAPRYMRQHLDSPRRSLPDPAGRCPFRAPVPAPPAARKRDPAAFRAAVPRIVPPIEKAPSPCSVPPAASLFRTAVPEPAEAISSVFKMGRPPARHCKSPRAR